MWEVDHRVTAAFHAEADGAAEHFNQIFEITPEDLYLPYIVRLGEPVVEVLASDNSA